MSVTDFAKFDSVVLRRSSLALASFPNFIPNRKEGTMTRFAASIVIALSILCASSAGAQGTTSIANAKSSAKQWLTLVDEGKYSESWDQASARFQSAVTDSSWQDAVRNVRAPLGKVIGRQLISSVFTHTLPGAPDGNYVVIHYATQFEHKSHATETVTPSQESDGSWKVSGYYVK